MRQNGLQLPRCQWALLPVATQHEGELYFCTDTPLGKGLVMSDGTKWRVVTVNLVQGIVGALT